MTKVSIVDYGMGNIRSVSNAVKILGAEARVSSSPDDLDAKKIIIPGVGAFGDAMKNLDPFLPNILEALESNIPILGICLGMQVFFENSEESPKTEGFSILKGRVTKIKTELNLPHIGWNSLDIKKDFCPLFRNLRGGYVYFAHSYYVRPKKDIVVATSEYGTEITASIWKENIFGTQFHPEKSGKLGLKILQNFLEL